MANLAAMDIAKMMEWASMKVYTVGAPRVGAPRVGAPRVGAPRVGNHAYAKEYNQLVPDTWGIINYRVRAKQESKGCSLYPGAHFLTLCNPGCCTR